MKKGKKQVSNRKTKDNITTGYLLVTNNGDIVNDTDNYSNVILEPSLDKAKETALSECVNYDKITIYQVSRIGEYIVPDDPEPVWKE